MKITIDATYTLHNKTGIGCYTAGLIDALKKYDSSNNYNLFYNCIKPKKYNIPTDLPTNFSNKISRIPRRWLIKLWNFKKIPADWIIGKTDLFVCTGLHIPHKLNAKIISIIYDISFLIDDITYSKQERATLDALIRKILTRSDFIITSSLNTKNDLINFYSYPQEKIEVIYGALTDLEIPLNNETIFSVNNILNDKKENIYDTLKYFLFVGSLERRKNLEIIIKAARLTKNNDYKIIFAGKPDNDYNNLKKIIAENNLNDKFIFTGYIDERDKWRLYKNCLAVLYPSIYEGFGYPALEAYYFNKPLITTRRGSIPELAGEFAYYIEPEDAKGLAVFLDGFINGSIKPNLNAIKRQSTKFDWQLSAQKFIDLIKKYV